MKKMFLFSALISVVMTLSAPNVIASPVLVSVGDKVELSDAPGDYPGGAFKLTNKGPTGLGNLGWFETFCVEFNENISFSPTQYTVAGVSNNAMNGGVAGGNPDPLDNRTAFLYTSFIENQSALGANWAALGNTGVGLNSKATAMQQAIWVIEQEIASTTNALANELLTLAGVANWQDTGRVGILNLVTANGSLAQDQLYLAPVPLPAAGLLMLSALGLGGLITRRRNAKAVK